MKTKSDMISTYFFKIDKGYFSVEISFNACEKRGLIELKKISKSSFYKKCKDIRFTVDDLRFTFPLKIMQYSDKSISSIK